MGQVLVIYDNEGYILSKTQEQPSPREPVGVPFLWVDIPEKKYIKSVDVSNTPHVAVLDDVPLTQTDLLDIKLSQQEEALVELANLIAEVLTS